MFPPTFVTVSVCAFSTPSVVSVKTNSNSLSTKSRPVNTFVAVMLASPGLGTYLFSTVNSCFVPSTAVTFPAA